MLSNLPRASLRLRCRGWLVLCVLLLMGRLAGAHPVAQGQMEVQWQEGELRIDARVSSEQILVASSQGDSTADSLAALHREHAGYLLAHLQVQAADRRLPGRVVAIATDRDFVRYRLAFALPTVPPRVTLRQDLLNEIVYAPGNPWEASFLVRSHLVPGAPHELLLASKNQPLALEFSGAQTATQLAVQFVWHGVQHILAGYDHLLFVGALVLAAVTLRSLMMVIAIFTLAHSITLALSSFGLVRLPSSLIEPMIAGSIVVVALANILRPARSDAWPRLLAVFFFGLFHGLGFAGGLLAAAAQLPAPTLALAVASFSVGVECAHLLVVIPLFLLLRTAKSLLAAEAPPQQSSQTTLRVGSAFISLAGMFYLVQALP